MSQLTFRDALPSDIPAIVRLMHEGHMRADTPPLDPATLGDPRYRVAYDEIAADPAHRLIAAERDGAVVGTIQISYLPGLSHFGARRAQFENVFVSPEHRGTGVGTAMMQWAIAQSRAAGCSIIQLTSGKVRTDAHRFYRRLGFEASHEGFKLRF